MDKKQILEEIARTAKVNGGIPLGRAKFSTETGIGHSEWQGKCWARWGDALKEAGFAPNTLNAAYEVELLLRKLAELAKELGRLPVHEELRMKARSSRDFPSHTTFGRLGAKGERLQRLLEFCLAEPGFEDVAAMCRSALSGASTEEELELSSSPVGYVYLLRHGTKREFKIGRTNNALRREGEINIELPRGVEPVHVIQTDDPAGIESYWHRRFSEKRLNGEWFELSAEDVRAFKRWRKIF